MATTPLRSHVQFHLWDLENFTLTIIHPHGPQGRPRANIRWQEGEGQVLSQRT